MWYYKKLKLIISFNSVRIKTELYYQHLYKIPVNVSSSYFSAANLGADFNSPNVDSLTSKGTGENYGVELTLGAQGRSTLPTTVENVCGHRSDMWIILRRPCLDWRRVAQPVEVILD